MAKADLVKRLIAALIDAIISAIPMPIPVIGPIIGAGYMLTKDAIVYELTQNEDFKNRSIGKKLMNLEVSVLGSQKDVDWAISIRRNIPLAIGSIIAIVPIIGWIIAAIVAPIIGLIEIILVLSDKAGRRLGDKFAETQVIEVAPAAEATEPEPELKNPDPVDPPQ